MANLRLIMTMIIVTFASMGEELFKHRVAMANLPSLEELLRAVPEEKRQFLDRMVEDYQLAEIAKSLSDWQEVVPYLGLTEAEETAIKEDNTTAERRRLAHLCHLYCGLPHVSLERSLRCITVGGGP